MKLKIGIYNLHMQAKGGGEKRTLVLAEHLSRSNHVWVFVDEEVNVPALEKYFNVDLSRVQFVALSNAGGKSTLTKRNSLGVRREVFSRSFGHFLRIKSFNLDLFINNSDSSNLPCPAPRGVYMCMFPHVHPISAMTPFRLTYRWLINHVEERVLGCRISNFINSYPIITANSHFTAAWIERLWGRRSDVIYSVCDTMGPPAGKEKIILNVGRFLADDAGGLHKRQDLLRDIFRHIDIQQQGWQLHFAGSVAPDIKTRTVVEQFATDDRRGSVFFHFDADLDTLRGLYRRAAIYWHATGYGFPADEHPDLQEHFGMATLEAMSAGAVPVVINAGGQKESVTHGVDGFLWDEPSVLLNYTERLMANRALRQRMSAEAVLSSAKFGRAVFNERVDMIIERLMGAEPCREPVKQYSARNSGREMSAVS